MNTGAPEGVDPLDLPLEERVEVVRMQSFSFDTRSAQSQDWPIAVGIDATTWSAAVLVVLVHQINAWASDTQLDVIVDSIALDPDDPKHVIGGPTIASVALTPSTLAGTSQVASFAPPWGNQLRVALRPFQRSIEATSEQRCTLTIVLVGRRQGILGAPHLLLRRASDR
jgi:hypothetical protein